MGRCAGAGELAALAAGAIAIMDPILFMATSNLPVECEAYAVFVSLPGIQ